MSFRRLAGLSGLGVVVLAVVSVVLQGSLPTSSDSGQEVIDYLAKDTDAHKIGLLFSVAILPFFVMFLAEVVTRLRVTDREHDEGWAIVTLAGGIALGATAGTGDALLGTLFYRGGSGLDAAVVRGLYDAQLLAYGASGMAIATLVGGVTASGFLHGSGSAWYRWLGAVVVVAGALSLVGLMSTSTSINFLVFLSLPALLVWVLATSVLMLRRQPVAST